MNKYQVCDLYHILWARIIIMRPQISGLHSHNRKTQTWGRPFQRERWWNMKQSWEAPSSVIFKSTICLGRLRSRAVWGWDSNRWKLSSMCRLWSLRCFQGHNRAGTLPPQSFLRSSGAINSNNIRNGSGWLLTTLRKVTSIYVDKAGRVQKTSWNLGQSHTLHNWFLLIFFFSWSLEPPQLNHLQNFCTQHPNFCDELGASINHTNIFWVFKLTKYVYINWPVVKKSFFYNSSKQHDGENTMNTHVSLKQILKCCLISFRFLNKK